MKRNGPPLLAVSWILVTGAALAADPPDLELNPQSGLVESVDIDSAAGDRVRFVEAEGQGPGGSATLVSSTAGANPRIAIAANGDTWVVWWQDAATDEVYYTVRDLATETWSSPEHLSEAGVESRNPEVVHDGSAAYVAYETDAVGGTTVVVGIIVDDPEPITTRAEIGTATFTGSIDTEIRAESGHVWVTWIDSATEVGWSEYDTGLEQWSQPQFESYVGVGVKIARQQIRTTVIGP